MRQGVSCVVPMLVSSLLSMIHLRASKSHYIMYFNLQNVLLQDPFYTKMNLIALFTKKRKKNQDLATLNLWLKLNFWNSGVLSGKAYLKTPFNLKAVVEALGRLLFEAFAEVENEIEIRPEALLNLINVCSSSSCCEQLDKVLKDLSVAHITNKIDILERRFDFGFPSWITLNWPFCSLMQQKQTNNRKLFQMEMSNLFFAFDRQHHLRSVLFSFFFWNSPW